LTTEDAIAAGVFFAILRWTLFSCGQLNLSAYAHCSGSDRHDAPASVACTCLSRQSVTVIGCGQHVTFD